MNSIAIPYPYPIQPADQSGKRASDHSVEVGSSTKDIRYIFGPMDETLLRLSSLAGDTSEYDQDFQGPTREAYSAARQMIEIARDDIATVDPVLKASPAAIGDGGIFIQWGNDENFVRLLIPADPQGAYIFRKSPESAEIVKNVNGHILLGYIQKLASDR